MNRGCRSCQGNAWKGGNGGYAGVVLFYNVGMEAPPKRMLFSFNHHLALCDFTPDHNLAQTSPAKYVY